MYLDLIQLVKCLASFLENFDFFENLISALLIIDGSTVVESILFLERI